jgi:hypothetical protein
MDTVSFSKTDNGTRLFFPTSITFQNIEVKEREKGVRLIRIPNPHHYDLSQNGDYDENQLKTNCTLICDNVQLEELIPENPGDTKAVHLLIGEKTTRDYADSFALYPEIHFTNCKNVGIYLGHCIASARFEKCTINTVTAPDLRGELVFDTCRIQPNVQQEPEIFYAIKSTLGTRFSNCTIHAPVVNGKADVEMINRIGFLEINKSVQHYHLNTGLANDVVNHFKNFDTEFITKLKSHHELES